MVVPIHQLAELFTKKGVITKEMAAGLKICFFPIARIYFESMAITAVKVRIIRLPKEKEGVSKNTRISAVI